MLQSHALFKDLGPLESVRKLYLPTIMELINKHCSIPPKLVSLVLLPHTYVNILSGYVRLFVTQITFPLACMAVAMHTHNTKKSYIHGAWPLLTEQAATV